MVILSKAHNKKVALFAVVFAMFMSPLAINIAMLNSVSGISLACRNSPECMAAVNKEQEANRNAASASDSANLFQAKVQELNVEIAGRELEIAETTPTTFPPRYAPRSESLYASGVASSASGHTLSLTTPPAAG